MENREGGEGLTGVIGVAAVRIALQMGPGHRIVTILCDSGTRHLSKFWAKAGNVGAGWKMTLEDVLTAEKTRPSLPVSLSGAPSGWGP